MNPRDIALVVVTGGMLMMAATMEAAELSGSWKGSLTGSDGSSAEVQVDFSLQGFPLYSYTNLSSNSKCNTSGQNWLRCCHEHENVYALKFRRT